MPTAGSSPGRSGSSAPSGPILSHRRGHLGRDAGRRPSSRRSNRGTARSTAAWRRSAGRSASALAYAHARGILHRDIKPSNLLLDTEGVVWVTDFGLAKVDDDELTRTGDILGTLRYMAPERFRGQGDARADLYSLGLTLYELLVLRPAFDSPDRLALSEQIKTVEPPRPRSIDPRIPRDLETIVLKAIEKDPGDRYATAEAMAEDLRRFLDDEPILARRASAPERYVRWARRNPVIAALGGVLTAVLLGGDDRLGARRRADGGAGQGERGARRGASATRGWTALAARTQAERQRERAEQHLYIARIGQAESALRLFDAATARGLLDQCRPGPGEPDRRGWEWSYLDQWCRPELQDHGPAHRRPVPLPRREPRRPPPGGRLLGPRRRERARVSARPGLPDQPARWPGPARAGRAQPGRSVRRVPARREAPGDLRGTRGRSGSGTPAAGGRSGPSSLGSTERVGPRRGLSWSPDGRRLATAASDGLVRIWDPETGRETARIAQTARSVAWSPDGTRIALGRSMTSGWRSAPGTPGPSGCKSPSSGNAG